MDQNSTSRFMKHNYKIHMDFLSNESSIGPGQEIDSYNEELKTAPLFSGGVLSCTDMEVEPGEDESARFPQYGLLSKHLRHHPEETNSSTDYDVGDASMNGLRIDEDPRIFLNVSSPWSAFICGSQGSGKSHTLSCMLENCLLESSLGKLSHPLAGLIFHYDRLASSSDIQICEAAYLSSGVPVRVLVSPTNLRRMKGAYSRPFEMAEAEKKPEVIPLTFQDDQLNVERMMTLMAVNEREGRVPLYIEVSSTLEHVWQIIDCSIVDTENTPANGHGEICYLFIPL